VGLGDSTTAGTPGFTSPIDAPPHGSGNPESQYAHWLIRMHPHWRVLNRGANGERSDQIRLRFNRDVLQARADLVVIIAHGARARTRDRADAPVGTPISRRTTEIAVS
jgi:lysophospholipase L1-like esterase